MATPSLALRASKLDRILTCPGSLTLEARVDARDDGDGDEGTYLHWKAHSALVATHGAWGNPGDPMPTPKQAPLVDWIADFYVRHIIESTPQDWSLEVEVFLEHAFARFNLTGHIDCVAMNQGATEAVIYDLKTGRVPVDPADNNEQVLGYGVLLRTAYPTLRKITAYIIQPLNNEDEGFKRISDPMVLEGDRLERALVGFEARINDALDRPMDLQTGVKACRWCPATLCCPAVLAERDSMKMTMTKEQVEAVQRTPNDTLLADWLVARAVITAPLDKANDIAKERIAEVHQLVASDGTIITAEEQNGSYKYPDKPKFLKALRVLLPKDEDLAEAVSFSMTAAEKTIARVNGIPATGKAAITGRSIVEGHLKPLAEQGKKTVWRFNS